MENEIGVWDVMNVLFRLGILSVVIVKLWRFYDLYNREERLGLGVMGGCVLMTIPVILHGPASPFNEWAATLFAFGVLSYLLGRLKRTLVHNQRNREMVRQARDRGGGQ